MKQAPRWQEWTLEVLMEMLNNAIRQAKASYTSMEFIIVLHLVQFIVQMAYLKIHICSTIVKNFELNVLLGTSFISRCIWDTSNRIGNCGKTFKNVLNFITNVKIRYSTEFIDIHCAQNTAPRHCNDPPYDLDHYSMMYIIPYGLLNL